MGRRNKKKNQQPQLQQNVSATPKQFNWNWNLIVHAVTFAGVFAALWQGCSNREQLEVAKKGYDLQRLAFVSEHSPQYRFEGDLLSDAPCIIVRNEGAHAPVLRGVCRAIVLHGKNPVELKAYYTVAHSDTTDKDILHFYFNKALSATTFAGVYWKGVDPINSHADAESLQLRTFITLECKDDEGHVRTDDYEMLPTGELAQRTDNIPTPTYTVDVPDYLEKGKTDTDPAVLNVEKLAADVKALAEK